MRLGVVGTLRNRGRESFDGVGVPPLCLPDHTEAELGRKVTRRGPHDLFECCFARLRVAHRIQCRRESKLQRRTIGRQFEPLAKLGGGAWPVFALERADAERLERLRALDQTFEFHHERVGGKDLMFSTLTQMLVCLSRIAESVVSE